MGGTQVTFFLDDEDLDRLRTLRPERDWREFQRGERAWVLQTYLHLASAGYPARLSSHPPETGLVVFHSKQRWSLLKRLQANQRPVLVAIRGDLKPRRAADFELVQNQWSADGKRTFFLPHWPQPGLLPRDASRGATVARAAYKGFDGNLHPYFRSAEWRGFLAERRIEWLVDSVPFAEDQMSSDTLDWPDFRSVDLLLAVRPADCRRRNSKPATKLYNAWLAGVPAVLSPDVAFVELRRSSLDFLEAQGPEQARSAVARLSAEPGLYRAMVQNGRERAAEHTVDAVVKRWIELLEEVLPARLAARSRQSPYDLPKARASWAARAGRRFILDLAPSLRDPAG